MQEKSKAPNNFAEFVFLMAFCMALVALTIDAMLPSLPEIGRSFNVIRPNSQQFVISVLFAGLAFGQLVAGPLSDYLGRKKAMYSGFALLIVGCFLSYGAKSFEMMLAGRFIQGLGAAGPRIITIAMVRDRFAGREMARTMSYIMGIFIFVPAIAPAAGQAIAHATDWRMIFMVFILISVALWVWLAIRIEETRAEEDKRPFTLPVIWQGAKEVCANRTTLSYMVAAGCIYGALIGYLNSSQQIFEDYFQVNGMFPLYFGIIALAIGSAFFINARYVRVFGMRRIVLWSLIAMAVFSFIYVLWDLLSPEKMSLLSFMVYIMASSFCMGMLFSNFNALAMEPMGHLAGIASAVIGCVSLIISATAGGIIGQLYDGNLMPLTAGFFVLSLVSLGLMRLAEKEDLSATL